MIPRNYKILSALAATLAAASILVAVTLFVRLDDQQSAFDQSRVDISYQICTEQNGHHDKAFRKLDELIDKLPPAQREQAKTSEDGTKELINTLAAHQDCLGLVQRRFGPSAYPSPERIRQASTTSGP